MYNAASRTTLSSSASGLLSMKKEASSPELIKPLPIISRGGFGPCRAMADEKAMIVISITGLSFITYISGSSNGGMFFFFRSQFIPLRTGVFRSTNRNACLSPGISVSIIPIINVIRPCPGRTSIASPRTIRTIPIMFFTTR